MAYSLREKVKWLAILSRVSIIVLQFILNLSIPDHNADAFRKPFDYNETNSLTDTVISSVFEGFTRWDAQYFLHIAQYGYTYENTLAFFPLFPLLLRPFSYLIMFTFNHIFGFLRMDLSFHSSLVVSSVIFNNVLFVKTATILYDLSLIVLRSEKLSFISCILFCVTPASIFFSAAYSESLYCFLSVYGMLQVELNNFFLGSIVFGLSALARSNGILNIGFILYSFFKLIAKKGLCMYDTIMLSICVVVSALPFVLYQFYCYLKYCFPGNTVIPQFIYTFGVQNNFILPGNNSLWCNDPIPIAYSYVQSHYWNVGFLKYYELKQTPNFLLALPVFIILFKGCSNYIRLHGKYLLYLGLKNHTHNVLFPIVTFPYVMHCMALAIFAALTIHIQVTTRLLFSSCPALYWFCAWFVNDGVKDSVEGFVMKKISKKGKTHFIELQQHRNSKWKTFLFTEVLYGDSFWVKYYYLTYFFVGTLMFSNYMPWT